ncbi:TetR/AcrR family transcriptional regulator C-terminal domain-containing protein [Streptomyces sp. NPDC056660]|uniref:TetR/AcrR family transcriptional regulator C-terminal domain-containing protein n=1 Tax=Streptomyces sp. NPDC056660 TaxID=3345897 RepID=UPI0036CF6D7F
MHDAVVEETLAGEVPGDWREALRMIARYNRAAVLRHPWLIARRDTGCPIGPASLKRMDESAAAVRELDAGRDPSPRHSRSEFRAPRRHH